ncbi:hypothetical protein [Nocardia carnea]|uniref:hypothetical protein n=1 Tax=Nocardia carnea TaxID=37328 RepID=UPI00245768E5|nr:hypothetical protein [Nocardia carnea]
MNRPVYAVLFGLALAVLITVAGLPEDDPVDADDVLSAAHGVALQLESSDNSILTSFEVSQALKVQEDGEKMKSEQVGEPEQLDNDQFGRTDWGTSHRTRYVITDLHGKYPACVTVTTTRRYLPGPGALSTVEAQALYGDC